MNKSQTSTANTIEKFYHFFGQLDAEAMVALYHEEVVFQDPAFGTLHGERAKNMWRMLCESQKGKDFQVKVDDIGASGNVGEATWEAFYTFSKTGRKIHNIINASFELKDGKIIRHIDKFDLYRWSRQALGMKGLLLGWTPIFKTQLHSQTNHLLDKYEKKN